MQLGERGHVDRSEFVAGVAADEEADLIRSAARVHAILSRWPRWIGVVDGLMSTLNDVRLSSDARALALRDERAARERAGRVVAPRRVRVGYLLRSSTPPPSAYHVQRVSPACPFFVVMTMTPFAASVP